jgi:hypothetical protein
MKKVLDCTGCNSAAEVAEKVEKDLATITKNSSKKNFKKKHSQKQTTSSEVQADEEVKPVKLSVWKRIKNWFKRL